MSKRMTLPCLERVRRQLDALEWLLCECHFDPERWKMNLSFSEEENRPVADLVLSRRGRRIRVGSVPDPQSSASGGIGARHFWIDGNHWYDEHAVGILTEALEPTEEEQQISRLCDLAEEVSNWVEAGDTSQLDRAVQKVRKYL